MFHLLRDPFAFALCQAQVCGGGADRFNSVFVCVCVCVGVAHAVCAWVGGCVGQSVTCVPCAELTPVLSEYFFSVRTNCVPMSRPPRRESGGSGEDGNRRRVIRFGSTNERESLVQLPDQDDALERQRNRETPRRDPRNGGSTPGRHMNSANSSYVVVTGSGLASAKELSEEEKSKIYKRCMEMNLTNKITAQNSWSLHLIDHLPELMKKNAASANFQQQSCMIDCSVNIYSRRIDSLESESLKFISSLHRTDGKKAAEPPEAGGDEGGAAPRPQPAKKHSHHGSTLESNMDNLDVRNVESQFDVDPLYQVTCRKFDASSAKGLLLNNIHIGTYCQLMLDSSVVMSTDIDESILWGGLNGAGGGDADAAGNAEGVDDDVRVEEEEGEEGDGAPPEDAVPPPAPAALPDAVDSAAAMDAAADDDDDVHADFCDGPDDDDCYDGPDAPDAGADAGAGADGDADAAAGAAAGAVQGGNEENAAEVSAAAEGTDPEPELKAPEDIEQQRLDEVEERIEDLLDNGGDTFHFFKPPEPEPVDEDRASAHEDDSLDSDSEIPNMAATQSAGWTGIAGMAGHWKFPAPRAGKTAEPGPAEEKRKRKGRETARIDFSVALTEAERKLLDPPKDPFSTLLKKCRERARALLDDPKLSAEQRARVMDLLRKGTDAAAMLNRAKRKCLYLPEDKHFELDSLFQPFTRSEAEWNLKHRALRKKQRLDGPGPGTPDRHAHWPPGADAAPLEPPKLENDDGIPGFGPPDVLPDFGPDAPDFADDPDSGDDGPEADDRLDFSTEDAMEEDPAAPAPRLSGLSDAPSAAGLGSPGGLAAAGVDLVEAPQQVHVPKVRHAKTAKQIDIKALKNCMWDHICRAFTEDGGEPPAKRPRRDTLPLTQLIDRMAVDVEAKGVGRAEDITIAFYFISLLHLCNEHGLELKGQEGGEELHIRQG